MVKRLFQKKKKKRGCFIWFRQARKPRLGVVTVQMRSGRIKR